MSRQIKDNADYFTHDADMRDDPKIKALRRKFKSEGYGVWCMLLEVITDSDNFRLSFDPEIIAGDFDIDPDLLCSIVHYCVQIGLLSTDNDYKHIWSKTMDKRFESLLSKRERDRGRLSLAKIHKKAVIASESTQRRVEKRREEYKDIAVANAPTILERSLKFKESLSSFVQEFGNQMVSDFYNYWTEHSENGKKMRFEKEKVFNTKLRLSTWKSRQINGFTKAPSLNPYKVQ